MVLILSTLLELLLTALVRSTAIGLFQIIHLLFYHQMLVQLFQSMRDTDEIVLSRRSLSNARFAGGREIPDNRRMRHLLLRRTILSMALGQQEQRKKQPSTVVTSPPWARPRGGGNLHLSSLKTYRHQKQQVWPPPQDLPMPMYVRTKL